MEVKFPARVIKGCLLLIKHRTVQGSSGLDVPETHFFFFSFSSIVYKIPSVWSAGVESLFRFPVSFYVSIGKRRSFSLWCYHQVAAPALLVYRSMKTRAPGDAFQESNIHEPGITHCWKKHLEFEKFYFSNLWIFLPVPSLSFCSAVPGVNFSLQ